MTLPKLQSNIAEVAFNAQEGDILRLYATDVSHNGTRVRWQVVGSNREYSDHCFNAMLLGNLTLHDNHAYAQALTAEGEMLTIEETALKVAGLWYGIDYGDQMILIEVNGETHCVGAIPTFREDNEDDEVT